VSGARTVLAIDPGRSKCGLAVVTRGPGNAETGASVLHQAVAATADLQRSLAELSARFSLDAVLVGDGTNSAELVRMAESAQDAPVLIVDEKFSTVAARRRYFEKNPPRGLRRLIPLSLQVPPRAYDDYVAVILAERFLTLADRT